MRVRLRFVLVATALLSLTARAVAAELKQPTGKWIVDFAQNMCVLQRDYGRPDAQLILAFRPQPMSENVTIYVFDAPLGRSAEYVPVKIGVNASAPPVQAQMATFDVRKENYRFNETNLGRSALDLAAASGTISFDAGSRLRLTLAVPELQKALAVLDECVVDLLASWGFTRDEQQSTAKLPQSVKPLHRYITANDYPVVALRRGESGANSARFRIDENGRTSDCFIVESSGSTALDATLCTLTRRFRYHPALDKAGKPIESIGFVRVRWALG